MMRSRVGCGALLLLALFGSVAAASDITISYLGHSCFTVQPEDGPLVMLDPYGSYVAYPGLPAPADIVLMTHGHIDHCPDCYGERERVEGDPVKVFLLDKDGRCQEKRPPSAWKITPEFRLHAIEGDHTTASGGGQGWTCMFVFEIDGIRFAHLGDLGRTLTADQIEAFDGVEIVFLPVGGAFTIGAAEAMTVIGQLPSVRVVFPMHYYVEGITPVSWAQMAPLGEFTTVAAETHVVREIEGYQVEMNRETLPDAVEVWILEYKPD